MLSIKLGKEYSTTPAELAEYLYLNSRPTEVATIVARRVCDRLRFDACLFRQNTQLFAAVLVSSADYRQCGSASPSVSVHLVFCASCTSYERMTASHSVSPSMSPSLSSLIDANDAVFRPAHEQMFAKPSVSCWSVEVNDVTRIF